MLIKFQYPLDEYGFHHLAVEAECLIYESDGLKSKVIDLCAVSFMGCAKLRIYEIPKFIIIRIMERALKRI